MRYFFRKNQRLHKESDIEPLIKEGNGFFAYPIKMIYRVVPLIPGDSTPCKVVMIVAKRHLKKAYMRNLVRRRMREAYRLNINCVVPPIGFQVQMAFIYIANDISNYEIVERGTKKLFGDLNRKLAYGNKNNDVTPN